MSRFIANVSFGKDSTAMVYAIVDHGLPLDEVLYYNTGAEFDAIYDERDRMLPFLASHGIEYTELRPREPFFYSMLARPVRSRATGEVHKHGYGWCGGLCRWGTRLKIDALERYSRGATTYVGIAADETQRLGRLGAGKAAPLAEFGMTEADCLALCYERGHEWMQDGVRLYDVLDRVSCWCCRNKNMRELRAMHDKLPRYWERLVALEDQLGQMKSKPLRVIGGEREC